jgi:hypothetical protein
MPVPAICAGPALRQHTEIQVAQFWVFERGPQEIHLGRATLGCMIFI